MSESSYKGSCLCGTIKFEVTELNSQAAHCHCSMCRKFHGAAFASIGDTTADKFRWLSGEEALKQYTADNGTIRTFCNHCGSSLTFATPRASADVIEIALGLFDDPLPIEPSAHIFVGSKANWAVIADGLPQYAEGRDSERLDR